MAKWRGLCVLEVDTIPWFVRVKTPFNKAFVEDIKKYPGAQWNAVLKVWLFPVELLPDLERLAAQHGFDVKPLPVSAGSSSDDSQRAAASLDPVV
jgi:hypothetical protein